MPPSPARKSGRPDRASRAGGGPIRTQTIVKYLADDSSAFPVDNASRPHPYSRPSSPSHLQSAELSAAAEFWSDASSVPSFPTRSSLSRASSPQYSQSSPSLVGGPSLHSFTAVNTPDEGFATFTDAKFEQLGSGFDASPDMADPGVGVAEPIRIVPRRIPSTVSGSTLPGPSAEAIVSEADGEDSAASPEAGEADISGKPSTSTSAVAPTKTPRPANAWILYRSEKLKAIAAGERMPPLDEFLARSLRSDAEAQTEDEASLGYEDSAPASEGMSGNQASKPTRRKKKKSRPNLNEVSAEELERIRQTMNHQPSDDEPRSLPPQAEISKLISFMWKNESRAVKKKYERLSDIRRMEHEALYPNYKYQPIRKAEKEKLKVERKREKEALRQEKIEKAREEKREKAREEKKNKKPAPKPPKPPKVKKSATDRRKHRSEASANAPFPQYVANPYPTPSDHQMQVFYPEQMPPNSVPIFDPISLGFAEGSQVFWAMAPHLPDYHVQPFALEPTQMPMVGNADMSAAGPPYPQTADGSAFPVQEPSDDAPAYLSFAPYDQTRMAASQPMPFVGEDGMLYHLQPESTPMPYVFEPGAMMPDSAASSSTVPVGYQLPDDMVNDLFALVPEQSGSQHQAARDLTGEDPADVLNRWENLDAPIQDQYTVDASELSHPTLAQIAADWATDEQNDPNVASAGWAQEQDPGYITVRVPYEHMRMAMTSGLPPSQGPLLGGSLPISPLNNDFSGVGVPLTTANAVNLQHEDSNIVNFSRPQQPSFTFSNSDELDAGFRLPSGVIASPFDLTTQDTQWKQGLDDSAFMQTATGLRKVSTHSSRDGRSRVQSSDFLSPVPSPGGHALGRKRSRVVGSSHIQPDNAM